MRRFARYKIRTLGRWYPTALPTGIKGKYRKSIGPSQLSQMVVAPCLGMDSQPGISSFSSRRT